MRDLSVFVDESGDFGVYNPASPYYIVTLVIHDQFADISSNVEKLNRALAPFSLPGYTVHAGPLIRREGGYRNLSLEERRRIFHTLFQFVRTSKIAYHPLLAEKRHTTDSIDLAMLLSKQLSFFLNTHLEYFLSFDRVLIYYDRGQLELAQILTSIFSAILTNVQFRRIAPKDYKLFQAADLLCTLELLERKAEDKNLSKTETSFFSSARELYRTYLRYTEKKLF